MSVAYIGPKPRTERPRKTKIDTAVAHVTHDSDTTFKVQRSKVKVIRPLWLAVLAGQHGHRVSNGSRCVRYMMYIVSPLTTCSLGGGMDIVAASRLQLINFREVNNNIQKTSRLSVTLHGYGDVITSSEMEEFMRRSSLSVCMCVRAARI